MSSDVADLLTGLAFAVGFAALVALAFYLGNRAQRRRREKAAPDVLDAIDDVLSVLPTNKEGAPPERREEHRSSSQSSSSSSNYQGGGGDFGGGGASGDY